MPAREEGRAASRRLKCLTIGPISTITELNRAWTEYLLSMMFRNPETVAMVKQHSEIMWREGLAALEADCAARRLPTDPPDFADTCG